MRYVPVAHVATVARVLRRVVSVLALLLVAAPVWSYTIILKDGTEIVAKDKYRLVGEKAYLVLPNGVETFINAKEIDVKATEAANDVEMGTARVLIDERVDKGRIPQKQAPAQDKETLGDLLGRREGGLKLPEVRKRGVMAHEDIPLTEAGFPDLMRLKRVPYQDGDVMTELMRYLQGQGVEGLRIYQGTTPARPFIEAVAGSEAIVFKVLKDTANALVQVHDRFPDRVEAVELLMTTQSQLRAAQFEITPDLAAALVSEKIDPPSFFYRHVQF